MGHGQPGPDRALVRRLAQGLDAVIHLPEEVLARSATKYYWSFVYVRDVCRAVLLALSGQQGFLLTAADTRARIPTRELIEKYYAHFPWPGISLDE
jgi:hypothetical protein